MPASKPESPCGTPCAGFGVTWNYAGIGENILRSRPNKGLMVIRPRETRDSVDRRREEEKRRPRAKARLIWDRVGHRRRRSV